MSRTARALKPAATAQTTNKQPTTVITINNKLFSISLSHFLNIRHDYFLVLFLFSSLFILFLIQLVNYFFSSFRFSYRLKYYIIAQVLFLLALFLFVLGSIFRRLIKINEATITKDDDVKQQISDESVEESQLVKNRRNGDLIGLISFYLVLISSRLSSFSMSSASKSAESIVFKILIKCKCLKLLDNMSLSCL